MRVACMCTSFDVQQSAWNRAVCNFVCIKRSMGVCVCVCALPNAIEHIALVKYRKWNFHSLYWHMLISHNWHFHATFIEIEEQRKRKRERTDWCIHTTYIKKHTEWVVRSLCSHCFVIESNDQAGHPQIIHQKTDCTLFTDDICPET